MRWVVFIIVSILFTGLVVATFLAVFYGYGNPTESEREVLFSVFIVEVGASFIALFYSLFGIRRSKSNPIIDGLLNERLNVDSGLDGAGEEESCCQLVFLGPGESAAEARYYEQGQKLKWKVELAPGSEDSYVRISISALWRICIEEKYLLVGSERRPTNFQPVGGVLKRYITSFEYLESLGVLDDDKIPIDSVSHKDLRVRVKGTRLLEFLDWYSSRRGREISPWREFYEELLATGILRGECFRHVAYEKIWTYVSGVFWSDVLDCYQLRIAEVSNLIPTEDQAKSLRGLMNVEDERYYWADSARIRARGVSPPNSLGENISITASWILDQRNGTS
ncbi:MAG: hypothetical protein AAGB46_01745 [Verrucomicrobiota bacterium]